MTSTLEQRSSETRKAICILLQVETFSLSTVLDGERQSKSYFSFIEVISYASKLVH